jgi:hypothetical protein
MRQRNPARQGSNHPARESVACAGAVSNLYPRDAVRDRQDPIGPDDQGAIFAALDHDGRTPLRGSLKR